jgi:hypothetical protein
MIFFKAQRQDIALITKIFEAMSHLAVVSTLDRQAGLMRAMCDESSVDEVRRVLENLPCTIEILKKV